MSEQPLRNRVALVAGAIAGRIVRITDGDGLVADVDGFGRLNIRLANVDAPEHDQPCAEAKEALGQLASPGLCRFRLLARDRYARVVAEVSTAESVLNEELVRRGHAWTYLRYLSSHRRRHYTALEDEARRTRSGLWGADTSPVPPWNGGEGRHPPRGWLHGCGDSCGACCAARDSRRGARAGRPTYA